MLPNTIMACCRPRVFNVRRFGARGNGEDCTTEVNAALAAAVKFASPTKGSSPLDERGAVVYFPPGEYTITDTLAISTHRIWVVGDGPWVTKIWFNPSSAKSLWHFKATQIGVEPLQDNGDCSEIIFKKMSPLYGCALKGLAILSLNDPDNPEAKDPLVEKTAILLEDVSGMLVEDVQVHVSFCGGGSIGLHFKGRDTSTINRVQIATNRPIVIDKNPTRAFCEQQIKTLCPNQDIKKCWSIYDADHVHFNDCYLISMPEKVGGQVVNEWYNVEIMNGANINAVTFDGYQAWCGGRGGFKWDDHDTIFPSNQLTIRNVRLEQTSGQKITSDTKPSSYSPPTPEQGWFAYIKLKYGLVGLIIENILGNSTTQPSNKDKAIGNWEWEVRNGIYLEHVNQVSIRHADFSGMCKPYRETIQANAKPLRQAIGQPPRAIQFGDSCTSITLEHIYHNEATFEGGGYRRLWLPGETTCSDPINEGVQSASLALGIIENGINTFEGFISGVNIMSINKQFTVFEDITIAPNGSHDSMTPIDVDGYQYVHYWVLAKHASNMAMDKIHVTVMFEFPGKMGATVLANLDDPFKSEVVPTAMQVNSGAAMGGYGGFVIRAPVIGPLTRIIVQNLSAETYKFSVYGYATR